MISRRKKSSRFRGSKTHARGFKKKARGSGHRGGFGMAGTGKRGDQKKTLILNLYGNDYFGKSKTLRRGVTPKKYKEINLDSIVKNLESFVKQGKAKTSKDSVDIDLTGYKILSNGELNQKMIIKASAASESTIEKVKKHGGQLILPEKKEEVKTEVKALVEPKKQKK
jgi:large subunit ribosomal protein L15